jgi:hypothetical protein
MARESLTRIGMRTFPSLLRESGELSEIPEAGGNSALSPVGQHTLSISAGTEGIGCILERIQFVYSDSK